MDEQTRSLDKTALDKTAIACGLLAVALGLFVVLSVLGILPRRGSSGGERWIGVVAGMAFVLAGIAVVVQTLAKATPQGELPPTAPAWVRVTLYLLSLAIVVSLATIGTWVAFGPGEREFSISIPFLPGWLKEPPGRAAFGFGAIITWLMSIVMAVIGARRLRGPKK